MEQSEIDKWLNRYPEMVYSNKTNTFFYQNIELDPFVWGFYVPIDEGTSCDKCGQHVPKIKPIEGSVVSYGLRHKDRPWIWLGTYDTPEKMWNQFLSDITRKQFEFKKYNQESKPWWKLAIGL